MSNKLSIRRLVENEAIFRQHNENVAKGLAALDDLAAFEGDAAPDTNELSLNFYCECSDENCRLRIPVKLDEYLKIHHNRARFVVVPGHEVSSLEKVVIKSPKYFVVEKFVTAPEYPKNLNKTDISNV